MSYTSVVRADRPIGLWPLNELSGTTAFDLAGSNNGTYVGGVTLGVAGPFGGPAASFDGTDDYVTIAHHASLNFGNGPFSIEFWVWRFDLSWMHSLFDKGYGGWGVSLEEGTPYEAWAILRLPDLTFGLMVPDTALELTSGAWHHIVFTKYANYEATVLMDSPISYWRLGEPSGTDAFDLVGSAEATYNGSPTLATTGLVAGGDTAVLLHRASSDYAYAAGVMPSGAVAGVTVEAWVKFASLTAGTVHTIVRWWHTTPLVADRARLYYHVNLGHLKLNFYDGTTTQTVNSPSWTPTVGVAYHVVASLNAAGETTSFYVNGSLLGGAAVDHSGYGLYEPAAGSGYCTMGYGGGDAFDGTLDEVAIYNKALTADQVARHYAAGASATLGYFNGVLDYNGQPDITFANTTDALQIGRRYDGVVGFKGRVSHLAIYDYALSPTAVAAHYRSAGRYDGVILNDKPVGYWRLGEASGNPKDSSGNGNHVTSVAGTPTYDVVGALSYDDGAVTFDGSTEYFSTPDHATLTIGDVFTLEAWIVPGATGASRGIISHGSNEGYLRVLNTGQLVLSKSNVGIIVQSNSVLPASGWHHVVATKNGSTVHLYIDGVDDTGVVTNQTCIDTGVGVYIGSQNGDSEYFNGSIDEAAIYNYALSATQVADHYRYGKGDFSNRRSGMGGGL